MARIKNRNRKQNKNEKNNKTNKNYKDVSDQIIKSIGPLVRKYAAQALRTGGNRVGNYIAPGVGGEFGQMAGAGISKILGFGDYKVSHNSLMHAPLFGKGESSVRIKNREYICDITSSTSFNIDSFVINPGNQTLFPWLSGFRDSFQQWQCNGMVLYFNTTSATAVGSTNTALGSVMLATNYDVNAAPFQNKAEILSSYFSTSGKPCEDIVHAIECAPKSRPTNVLYIDQHGEGANNPSLYDLGVFSIATAGVQAASVVGELWISYDITLMKPFALHTSANSALQTAAWDVSHPLGITLTTVAGRPMEVLNSGTYDDTVDLNMYRGRTILVTHVITGTTMSGMVVSPGTYTGLTAHLLFSQGATHTLFYYGASGGILLACYDVTTDASIDPVYKTTIGAATGTPTFITFLVSDLGSSNRVDFTYP